jgi:hypothetical protein
MKTTKVKFYQCVLGTILAVASLGFPSKVNAQYQIPVVPLVDPTRLQNGGLVLELCKQYIYQASMNPNSLELQQLALHCQSLQAQYAQCIITSPPEYGLQCTADLSDYAEGLLRYSQYLQ